MWLMHHELAHTLYSHLAAIFGNLEPIAIKLPAEWSDKDEPLWEDLHSKLDGTDSVHTAHIVKGKDVELQASTATENPEEPPHAPDGLSSLDRSQETEQSGREHNMCNPDCNRDHGCHLFELKMTKIYNRKPSSIMPAGIHNIPSTPSTNNTVIYPKVLGDLPNTPDGMLRGDIQETAKSGQQWQHTKHEVNQNDRKASHMGNFNILTSAEVNSETKCRILCSDIQLSVPQNLHQNIYLCEQLDLCQNGKDNYIFGYHQNSCHYIIFCGRFDNQQKIIFQQVCQNIIFHGLFWWLSKHNIRSSSKSIVWIIYFDSQSNLLPTERPFNARSQTAKCPLTAHLVSSVVDHSHMDVEWL